ncbi:MAG TPA: hypothetical protein GX506_03665 [Firmicutes bacterium]|nr:hypothetical protein [Bacillota bacterium]
MPSRARVEVRNAWGVVVGSIKGAYAYLGTVLLLSVISFLWFAAGTFIAAPIVRFVPLAIGTGFILSGPVFAAVAYTVNRVLDGEDIGVRDFVYGLTKLWARGLALTLCYGLMTAVLLADVAFFLGNKIPWVKFIAIPVIYAIIFVGMMFNYSFPILVLQDPGLRKILKRSALLSLDNPVFTIMISIVSLVILAACIIFAPALMLVFGGLLGFLQVGASRELFKKYGLLPGEDAGGRENGGTASA